MCKALPLGSYKTFKYEKPEDMKGGKGVVLLAESDVIRGKVQIVRDGGENNLHSHKGMDGFWFVLKGRVKFYGPGDALIAELGPHEGILTPRGTQYWFESAGDEELELLQMQGFEAGVADERIDFTPQNPALADIEVRQAETR